MPILQKITAMLRTAADRATTRIDGLSDTAIMTALALGYLAVRILTLPLVEFGGDVVYKWRVFRYFHAVGTWFPTVPDHHLGRWAQNLPALGVIRLLDSAHPMVSMIVPVITGLGVLLLVYLISRRIAGKTAALLTALAVMGHRTFTVESAQLLPSMSAAFYTLLALELMLRHLEEPRRLLPPFLAGAAMGLAWGSKVTAAYWCVGIALHLICSPGGGRDLWKCRRFRIGADLLLFSLGFLILFAVETVCLNRVFGVTRGRFSLLFIHSGENPHLALTGLTAYLFSPVRFFLSLRGKGLDFVPKATLFLLTVPTLWFTLKHEAAGSAKRMLAVVLLVAGLFHCYLVTRIFPFRHPERPLLRYFFTLACVALILVIAQYPALLASLHGWRRRITAAVTGACFALYAIFAFAAVFNDPLVNNDNLFNTIRSYRGSDLQRREGFPLLIRYHRGREFTSRTAKLIIAWKSLTGDIDELPLLQNDRLDELSDKWGAVAPVVNADGERFFLLRGKQPPAEGEILCAVVDEQNLSLRRMRFRPDREGGTRR